MKGDEAKKKWRSKRDAYRKLKNVKTKSGQAATTHKWMWISSMTFLDPFIYQSLTEGNLTPATKDDTVVVEEKGDEVDNDSSEDENLSRSNGSNPMEVEVSACEPSMSQQPSTSVTNVKVASTCKIVGGKIRKRQSRTSEDQVGQAILELCQEKKKQMQEKKDESEEDKSFMKWCLAQLKKLPDQKEMETKIEIMNLIYYKLYTPQPFTPQN